VLGFGDSGLGIRKSPPTGGLGSCLSWIVTGGLHQVDWMKVARVISLAEINRVTKD
jgi:hypothetical protein